VTNSQLTDILLRLGDDSLVLSQRLGEWCGHAPILEEDIALTNIALDLLGQTQSYLTLAGSLLENPQTDDELAFHRDSSQFQNLLLLEQPNGDFGDTIARQFLFDVYSLLKVQHLEAQSVNTDIAAVAAKAVKEIRYHVDHSSKWVIRLGDGTPRSHDRIQKSINALWKFTDEMFISDESDNAGTKAGLLPDSSSMKTEWLSRIKSTLNEAGLTIPENVNMKSGGRKGQHSEHLSIMLEEMQVLPRLHPGANW
jgi:ring-1,2-phenylacetyl-CoA epoxidase subunit PaaC